MAPLGLARDHRFGLQFPNVVFRGMNKRAAGSQQAAHATNNANHQVVQIAVRGNKRLHRIVRSRSTDSAYPLLYNDRLPASFQPASGLKSSERRAYIFLTQGASGMRTIVFRLALPAMFLALVCVTSVSAADEWIVFDGGEGPGRGKHIVLVSGDEEYRSEEALPQLAKILSKHHGFKCTVLFAIDSKTGVVNPNQKDNIPGLESLATADLMVIFTRFRDLPDEQMKHIVDYVESGRPIIGIRTATHAFDIKGNKTYSKYGWTNKEWDGGFGRQVLGETWINHHGKHG